MADRRPVADLLSAEAAAQFDPYYLYFLRHLYINGVSCTAEFPAVDGVSPPILIEYDRPQQQQQPVAQAEGAAAIAGGGGEDDEPEEPVVIDPPAPPAQPKK
jgi:hypothetical protein